MKVDYAFEISGRDETFVYLLEAENGLWTHDRRSIVRGANGHWDWGLCQVSSYFHPKIVNDPRFKSDWKWQMDQCLKLYQGGTKFYGRANIKKVSKNFYLSHD